MGKEEKELLLREVCAQTWHTNLVLVFLITFDLVMHSKLDDYSSNMQVLE